MEMRWTVFATGIVVMRLRLAHYRNRFSMFRIYYALRAGLVSLEIGLG